MRNIIKFIALIAMSLLAVTCNTFAAFAPHSPYTDKLNIAGTYTCTGYDSHDGYYSGNLTLTLDAKASDFSNNFGSYHFSLIESDAKYTGEVAAQGDILAIYFENIDSKKLTDRGVGIATISHDQDKDGKFTTTLHKFYYQPTYMRNIKGATGDTGGHGTEECVKTDVLS